ncbi:nonribosomal peptide synthetase [Phanerochaete sordida]|uniref:Nonribosomal peptide synthetase n=1 Tax=Phanerochaete sordida TaxID=48140 RepID=A0A9P3GR16_9APHY|nr:nonribosomal peptide synthetase [Phanerochaete sordida]
MASISSLSAEDASLFRRFGFGRREEPPFRCVHHAFEYHVRSNAGAVAAEHLGATITYGELDRRANALAHHLRAMGVRPGARVCLLVQRSIPMVVGIIAVLKAGGAYVPLDGGIVTDSTLAFVLENAKCTLALTLTDYVHRVADFPNINLDEVMKSQDVEYDALEDLSSPDDSCYIIYTSGE